MVIAMINEHYSGKFENYFIYINRDSRVRVKNKRGSDTVIIAMGTS